LIHDRHFTRAEADAMVPKLETLMGELRQAKESLTDAEAHKALSEASGGNGGGSEGRKVGEAFLLVRGMLAQLHEAGIVVRDIDGGLLDFPALLEDREVYLCWRVGEERVAYWHDLDSGFQGRQPLE
jgi:hypothetical protein